MLEIIFQKGINQVGRRSTPSAHSLAAKVQLTGRVGCELLLPNYSSIQDHTKAVICGRINVISTGTGKVSYMVWVIALINCNTQNDFRIIVHEKRRGRRLSTKLKTQNEFKDIYDIQALIHDHTRSILQMKTQ